MNNKYFAKIVRHGAIWDAEIWQENVEDDLHIVNMIHSKRFITQTFARWWAKRDLRKHNVDTHGYYEV